MKQRLLLPIAALLLLLSCSSWISNIDPEFRGLSMKGDQIKAQFWIQDASDAALWLYDSAHTKVASLPLARKGNLWLWQGDKPDLAAFYTLAIERNGNWAEDTDPWVKAVSINGDKGALLDLSFTDPENWEEDRQLPAVDHPIIYELQIRDFSSDPEAEFEFSGQFLAFTERGKSLNDEPIGIDHLIEMGVSHVHIMPFYDFSSIDESLERPPYNWGYDPHHYNAVEGTFASDAIAPAARIRECKSMIQALHKAGIGVIMDVVYNHTSVKGMQVFNHIAPDYYFRTSADGSYSDASACGNETASEQKEMRRFIVQSLKYWAEEYHIDGFRFDLMAIHDIETMQMVEKELKTKYPDMLLYGEGWKAGSSPLPDEQLLLKCNTSQVKHIAAFSDEFRNGIKGNVFDENDKGFVGGDASAKENIKYGLVGATAHKQVNSDKVSSNECGFWAPKPDQCIGYASCHDNHTLYDKLALALPKADHEELMIRAGIAQGLVLTGLAVPFIHSGGEMGRTKQGVENSFESPDSINQLDWSLKSRHHDLVEWVQQLIDLRKQSTIWRLDHPLDVDERIEFLSAPELSLRYRLYDQSNRESIQVLINVSKNTKLSKLPNDQWKLRASWPKDSRVGTGLGMWIFEYQEN